MRTINHPEKYHNPFQMFCQANKPNIGILQEKKNHFVIEQPISLLENWIPCFLFCMYGTARGFGKESIYSKANYQGLVHLPQKAESLKQ